MGEWAEIRSDQAARFLARGPDASGVFARVTKRWIELLDERGQVAGEAKGFWRLPGRRSAADLDRYRTNDAGVLDAVSMLDSDQLEDRYAIGVSEDVAVPIPVAEQAP